MASSKGIIAKEAQVYIRDIHRDTLVQCGFSSLDGNDIAWYRIVNGEVLQSILFFTRHTFCPIILDMAYGSMPLYLAPMFPKGPYLYSLPDSREICTQVQLMQGNTIGPYSQASSVMCPMEGCRGLDILKDEVLAPLNQIDSASSCFAFHRSRYAQRETWHTMSMDFIDEVLYRQEQDLYEVSKNRVAHLLLNFDRYYFPPKEIPIVRHHLELQQSVLRGGSRIDFIDALEKRKQNTLRILRKRAGIG